MSKTLQNLLTGVPTISVIGDTHIEIKNIEFDLRKASAGVYL